MVSKETEQQITVIIPVASLGRLVEELCKMAEFGRGGKDKVITVYKTASQTKINDATLADDADLKLNIGANQIWAFRMLFDVTPVAAMTWGWTVPSGTTIHWGRISTAGDVFTQTSTLNLVATGVRGAYGYHGIVRAGAVGGEVAVRWAQTASDANATTLERDSHIIAHRLA